MSSDQKNHNYVNIGSHNFKIFMVFFIFSLALLRLLLMHFYPNSEIIPDRALLGVILVIMIYLWIQSTLEQANLIALNKDLQDAYEHLKNAELDTITTLIRTVEAKDPYTCGHSERVTSIALEIAKEMNLATSVQETISRAGPLHDIGKIAISDAILHKKERLTDEDWSKIKEHPKKGAEILKSLRFLAHETKIILHHHERIDGKGYPDGLKDTSIPLEDQIISVADTFDAMNSARPYREKLTKEFIIEELKRVRGSQLSPQAVDTLINLLDKNPMIWDSTR